MISDTSKTEKRLMLDFVKIGKFSISVLVVYYMWYNEKFGHNTIVVYGSFLLMCVCLLIDLLENGELSFADYHIGIWGNFAIVLYSFATGFFVAYSQSDLVDSLKLVVQYSVIAFSTYHFAKKSEKGLDWFFISVNFAALLCCYSLIKNPVLRISGRYSLSNTSNPNTLGFIFVIGIFAITYRFRPIIKWFVLYTPQIILMIYGIIQTGSRKALFAVLILIMIWIIESLRELNRMDFAGKYLLFALILIIFILSGRYLFKLYSGSYLAIRVDGMFDDESNDNRINYYIRAWRIFKDKPLFGGGYDQFKYWSRFGSYAHSTYAETIADFGLIGCFIYFYPLLESGFSMMRSIFEKGTYRKMMILALWFVEMFMAVGQIFLIDITHYFAWLIIFFECVRLLDSKDEDNELILFDAYKRYKYIK